MNTQHRERNIAHANQLVGEQQIEQFERDGAIILRGVLPPEWVQGTALAIDEVMERPTSVGSNLAAATGKEGRFHQDFFVWRIHPQIKALITDSPLAALAARMMRSSQVNFFYDQLLVKEPGTAAPTPWHQDIPYWPVTGWQVVSIWVPFDLVTPANGVVTYVKGSHQWGKLYRPRAFGTPRTDEPAEVLAMEEVPDVDGRPQDFEFITGVLKPGDVFVHHSHTLHGAPGNSSGTARRRALATRWTGDDARFHDRAGSFLKAGRFQPYRHLLDLKPGDPMTSELFPRVL